MHASSSGSGSDKDCPYDELAAHQMLELLGGEPAAIPIVEVEPEEFDFEGNLDSES